MKESKKYLVIKAVCEGKKQKNRACVELGLSKRQVNRLILAYRKKGKSTFVHGNRSKRPTHAMSLETKRRIIEKYQSYGDLRPDVVHFCELLAEEENIAYSDTTVRKLLYQAGFLSPKTQRATKRRLKQEAKQKKREAEKRGAKLPTFLANMAEVTTFFQDGQHDNLITLAVDNDEAGHTFIERLTAKGVGLTQDLPPIVEGRDKTDWNDYLKMTKEGTQKDLKDIIETASYHTPKIIDVDNKKSLEETQEIIEDRASVGEGYLQPEADGSTKPVVETTTFEQTVTSHPTSPYRYLHFSTNFEEVQRRQSKYHPIEPDDLKRMNQYSPSIQRIAQWYLEELSGSHIYYFYSDHGEMNILDVSFKQENFLHLTGISLLFLVKKLLIL